MSRTDLRDQIICKAGEFGADDAGVCLASELLSGPAHSGSDLPGDVDDRHSVLVIALSHPPDQPELDYFIRKDGFRFGNSKGNRRLMDISDRVGRWLKVEGIASRDLHYYVEHGGVFLKDAAVLAGLGTVGKNNLLIHPGFGPRVRFRAHLVGASLTPSTPLEFDPCLDCRKPCLGVCPEKALDHRGYWTEKCQVRLDREFEEGVLRPAEGENPPAREARYCRECELACSYTGSYEL